MDTIEGMRTFLAVVNDGSFVGGARKLMISPALASKYVGELEHRLGVRLLNRTTRSLSVTELGEEYVDRCRHVLASFDEMENVTSAGSKEPQGDLKLTAPAAFAERYLIRAIAAFRRKYPGISVDLDISDQQVDLVSQGIDLAIRDGALDDSSLVCKRLLPASNVICATPEYLAENGTPTHPLELENHACILDANMGNRNYWPMNIEGRQQNIPVSGGFAANSLNAIHAYVLASTGIAKLPAYCVGDDLKAGRLEEVLRAYATSHQAIYAIYPHSKYLPNKVRHFIDFLGPWFKLDSSFSTSLQLPANSMG
ncbi:LysR family transcriptional regulator [Sneathiella marina]|uniref:LysR family transcriptional regulator n=1 Tax=Sneathiella marina TaxID=2950108 RepID=A0ABY4W768_9PROT|nr:LysR family transcriptional regulator [Sneathiella marina]USG61114.1 LysR family transcriptional regulator [Sneathiella marina]